MTKKSQNSKKSLLEMALSATQNNVTTRKSRKSINDYLFQMLFEDDREMTKAECIAEISLDRLENSIDDELTAELFSSEEIQEQFKKINKTVKNGFEAAICSGKTSASFCSNKRFDGYVLAKNDSGTYTITKK